MQNNMHSNTLTVNTLPFTHITFPKFDECGLVNHLFSTRDGGVSSGIYATMNTGSSTGDSPSNIKRNFEILCECAGINPENLVLSEQTHTSNVMVVDKSFCGYGYKKERYYTDVDGLITNVPNVALVTQYADCTPLLFCDTKKKVIATSHAGWRGTVKEIGKITVEKMKEEFGCDPSDIIAGIGPSIMQCCYEVDTPVFEAFKSIKYLKTEDIFVDKGNGKYMLSLQNANKQILIAAGIKEENIDVSDLCTCCHSNIFHSHRATGGKRGNCALIIELK